MRFTGSKQFKVFIRNVLVQGNRRHDMSEGIHFYLIYLSLGALISQPQNPGFLYVAPIGLLLTELEKTQLLVLNQKYARIHYVSCAELVLLLPEVALNMLQFLVQIEYPF